MHTSHPRPRTLAFAISAVLALVAIADFLFYQHHLGWTAALFTTAILAAITARAQTTPKLPWLKFAYATTALISLTMLLEPGPLKISLAFLSLIVIALGTQTTSKTPLTWITRVLKFLCLGWSWLIQDYTRARRATQRRGRGANPLNKLRPWLLPITLTLVFVILFAIANPIIESWMQSLATWLSNFTDLINPQRFIYWSFFAVWLWALLRPHPTLNRPSTNTLTPTTQNPLRPTLSYKHIDRILPVSTIIRCLILFNIVFAVQSLLDLTYLTAGAELPEGMTYKEYARRGAYPLVATALLAGLFVILAFRTGAKPSPQLATARKLVYAFLAQNIFLLISAIWRLTLYIDAYQMTRLRVAAAIWMSLVLVGFIWIIIRILTNRSNTWLIITNAATAAVVLLASCFINFDAFIANYNVQTYTQTQKEKHWIDIEYLEHLGPASLPALYKLQQYNPNLPNPNDAEYVRWTGLQTQDVIYRLTQQLHTQTTNWRGWTYRRTKLKSFIQSTNENTQLATKTK